MVDVSDPLPTSLDVFYSSSSPDPSRALRYDGLRLTEPECSSLLHLPLAKRVFGHGDESTTTPDWESLIRRVRDGEISYTQFVSENVDAVLRSDDSAGSGAIQAQLSSQLLHIGLAALLAFLQS